MPPRDPRDRLHSDSSSIQIFAVKMVLAPCVELQQFSVARFIIIFGCQLTTSLAFLAGLSVMVLWTLLSIKFLYEDAAYIFHLENVTHWYRANRKIQWMGKFLAFVTFVQVTQFISHKGKDMLVCHPEGLVSLEPFLDSISLFLTRLFDKNEFGSEAERAAYTSVSSTLSTHLLFFTSLFRGFNFGQSCDISKVIVRKSRILQLGKQRQRQTSRSADDMNTPRKWNAVLTKDKEKPTVKFRGLQTFFAESSEEDQKKFLVDHYENVFLVLHEYFTAKEQSFSKGRHLSNLLFLLDVLQKICVQLPSIINSSWQLSSISTIIHKGLYRHNQHEVRAASLSLLMCFIEALQNSITPNLLDEFATAVPLEVFVKEGEKVNFQFPPPTDSVTQILFPSATAPTMQESLTLLDGVILKFISETSHFLFWFDLFKTKYLVTFYPAVFKELRLLDKYHETGFHPICPPHIQQTVIGRLSFWAGKPGLFSILWDPNANSLIMMELHRNSCLLPLVDAATMKLSTKIFRTWLMSGKNKPLGDQIQQLWQHFMTNLSLIFLLDSTPEQVDEHHKLCRELVHIFTQFATDFSDQLSNETWEKLQYTLLSAAFDLLNKASPQSSQYSKTTFDLLNAVEEEGGKTFGDLLFGSLYFVWLRSQKVTEDMWQDLSRKVASLVNWRANVLQWKEKVIQLTSILRDHMYPVDPQNDSQNRSPDFSTPNVPVTIKSIEAANFVPDTRLTSLTWTKESIHNTWLTLLFILGDITSITDPASYELTMSCVSETINILINAQLLLPLREAPPLPLMKIFLPWLIESCVYNERQVKGLILAYRALCKIFLGGYLFFIHSQNRDHYLSHFYRIGLNNVKSEVICEIIQHSASIFLCDLPGVAVLIPDYLREIEVLSAPVARRSNVEIKRYALLIVNSLICHPNHYHGLEYPIIATPKPYEVNKSASMTTEDVKEKITRILINILNNPNETDEVLMISICGAVAWIFEEIAHPNPRMNYVSKFIESLIEQSEHANINASRLASDSLSDVASLVPVLLKVDRDVVVTMLLSVADRITWIIGKNGPEQQVVQLLYCMRDIVLNDDGSLLSDLAVAEKVFKTVEISLLGGLVSTTGELSLNPGAGPGGDNAKDSSKFRIFSKDSKQKNQHAMGTLPRVHKRYQDSLDDLLSKSINSLDTRDAAETVLLQLLNFHNNFPSPGGAETTSGRDEEYDKSKTMYFSYEDTTILAFSEEDNGTGARTCKIVIRDSTGQYVWKAEPIMDDAPTVHEVNSKSIIQALGQGDIPPSKIRYSPYRVSCLQPKGPGEEFEPVPLNTYPYSSKMNGIDVMEQTLKYLEGDDNGPKCFGWDAIFGDTSNYLELASGLQSSLDNILKQSEVEADKGSIIHPNEDAAREKVTETSVLQYSRMFLSQMGFLDDRHHKLNALHTPSRLFKQLRDLDLMATREHFRVAVVYVGAGQETSQTIMENSHGSPLYQEFLEGLGWSVDLNVHVGFSGSLSKNNPLHPTAPPYYATPSTETIFQVLSQVKAGVGAPLERRRLLASCSAHIIWSEHEREYKPDCLVSTDCQAGKIHIVIYPLPDGLFRVGVLRRQEIPFFGPLMDGMLLSKSVLCELIRQTVVNGVRRLRQLTNLVQRPVRARRQTIREIIKENRSNKSVEAFLQNLYPIAYDFNAKNETEEASPSAHLLCASPQPTPPGTSPPTTTSQSPVKSTTPSVVEITPNISPNTSSSSFTGSGPSPLVKSPSNSTLRGGRSRPAGGNFGTQLSPERMDAEVTPLERLERSESVGSAREARSPPSTSWLGSSMPGGKPQTKGGFLR
ncbi:ral GTPase-activating protein subunit alpha-2 [Planoprotostelium fungivorum]|uniref:Ral GTPase-activating protein subunit alpha-2 n=1 Tax=Planoprotostelium fungivorum TaxID=1890364 RepID=A0A2P6NIM0_9EUKA|nr:ral GTPase-activating protein subunit alpha-2 [Planoprotostelium fungivorum]